MSVAGVKKGKGLDRVRSLFGKKTLVKCSSLGAGVAPRHEEMRSLLYRLIMRSCMNSVWVNVVSRLHYQTLHPFT